MATMKLYELVNHYHIGTELTCAEAVFMACNEYYHLNLSEETRKMFSVMGLGMQTEQSCCGAFTAAPWTSRFSKGRLRKLSGRGPGRQRLLTVSEATRSTPIL